MYVKSLELSNIRGFAGATLQLAKGINIITGVNNSGKSTLIKSFYRPQDPQAFRESDLRKGSASGEVLITLGDVSSKDEAWFREINNGHVPLSAEAALHFRVGSNPEQATLLDPPDYGPLSLDLLNGANFRAFRSQPLLEWPRTEDKNNFIYPFFSRRKTNYYTSSGGKDNTFQVLDDLRHLPSKVQKTAFQSVTKQKFEYYCRDILGFDIAVIPSPNPNNENSLGIYTGYNSTIALDAMGEGVANIVGLITILLTQDNKLFLIEELENDIHPTALKKLLNLIIEKSDKNQFIISTHSNIILKYLGSLLETKIFFTEVDYDRETSLPTSRIEEVGNAPHERLGVLERLGYDLFDYDLYAGFLILEESSAERIIRDILIPSFVPGLTSRLRTIAAQGAPDLVPKFNDLHRLFLYLHKAEIYRGRAWVLADGDIAGVEAIKELHNKFSTWRADYFSTLSAPYFEKYYPERFQGRVCEVMAIQGKKERQLQKQNLLEEVLLWYNGSGEEGKATFRTSAREVIEKLQQIAASL